MELEKQKNISRVIHNTLKRFEDFPKDSFEIKSIDLKYVLEYTVFLEKELDRLQKENDLAKKALIANSYEADERNNLLAEVQRLKKENEKLKEIDLTTVHIKGVCDERERWRNKIREKIKEIYEDKFNKYYDMFLEKRDIEKTISILKDLLKEE